MLDHRRAVGDILSNARILPSWLETYKTIKIKISKMIECDSSIDFNELNNLVRDYNKSCPPQMQKVLITSQNYQDWK